MEGSLKWKLFNKSIQLHRKLAKRHGVDIELINGDKILIRKMDYDRISSDSIAVKTNDYIRSRIMELCAEEIRIRGVRGEVAEAGVFMGEFSWVIEKCFPERKLYLYDTFEGFDEKDMATEKELFKEGGEWLNITRKSFRNDAYTPDEQIQYVLGRLEHPENAVVRKGFFPKSAEKESSECFSFVSLDMDLYKPILEGILFFYPKLDRGGYIFIHDYNCSMLKESTHKALSDAENILGELAYVPISDIGGSVVIVKR